VQYLSSERPYADYSTIDTIRTRFYFAPDYHPGVILPEHPSYRRSILFPENQTLKQSLFLFEAVAAFAFIIGQANQPLAIFVGFQTPLIDFFRQCVISL
jgi:hypothetical protein